MKEQAEAERLAGDCKDVYKRQGVYGAAVLHAV